MGCGGAPATTPATTVSQAAPETTQVFLLASSAGGDEPLGFTFDFSQIQLTNKAGAVTVLSDPTCADGSLSPTGCYGADFMQSNGTDGTPFYSARVPRGIYTGAAVVPGTCDLNTAGDDSNGGLEMNTANDALCGQAPNGVGGRISAGTAVVSVPQPVTLTSYPMALILSLDAPASYQISGCADIYGSNCTVNFSPQFTLTAVALLPGPDAPMVRGLNAQIESISGTSLQLQSEDGAVTMDTGPSTIYSGVNGFAGLAPKMFVRLSGSVQTNGTLLASRVEVDNSTAQYWDDGVVASPVGPDPVGVPAVEFVYITSLGSTGAFSQSDVGGFATTGAAFAIAGPASLLTGLPFTPTFTAQTLVAGQRVSLYLSGDPYALQYHGYPPASTVVLVPQVIQGVVTAVGSSGQDLAYTVQLAPTDLIPQLGSLSGDYVHLADPATIYVYASPTTAMAAPDAVNADTTWRFRGLLFNDNGTLRMVCDAILPAAAPAGN